MAEHVADLLAPVAEVTVRRFFDGWGLIHRGEQIGMVLDAVYFRVDDDNRAAFQAAGGAPFTYRADGRPVVLHGYYSVPDDALDDRDRLRELARQAIRPPLGPP